MSGSAGAGKSTVISCLYQLVSHYFSKMPHLANSNFKPDTVRLCAPSGKAAFLINGSTLHSSFALPIVQFGGSMPELSEDIANTIRTELFNLKLLIIDEISMVGSRVLHQVDTRLRQIMGLNKSFGGVSVLLVGDLHQLPPVIDKPIYFAPNNNPLNIFTENTLWKEFSYFELTEIMREEDDIFFIHALNNLAIGNMSEEDIKLIRTRETQDILIPSNTIRLYAENVDVDNFNAIKIKENVSKQHYILRCRSYCFIHFPTKKFNSKIIRDFKRETKERHWRVTI